MDITIEPKIKNLYIGFAACIILSSMPNTTLQNIAAIFSMIFIIATYIQRKKFAPDSLEYNHANYIIRLFWLWSFIFVTGMIIAGLIISKYGDMSAIDQMTNAAINGIIPTEETINQMASQYFETNFQLILETTLFCLAPAQIYGALQLYKGFCLAKKAIKTNAK